MHVFFLKFLSPSAPSVNRSVVLKQPHLQQFNNFMWYKGIMVIYTYQKKKKEAVENLDHLCSDGTFQFKKNYFKNTKQEIKCYEC